MGKGKRTRDKKKAQHRHAGLDAHERIGKVLTPPMLAIPKLKPSSWIDERLPDMLWAALLITHLPRDLALEVFRRVAKLLEGQFSLVGATGVGHTDIAQLPSSLRNDVIALICSAPRAAEVLRPLLLLNELPVRDDWERIIGQQPEIEDWELLRVAVARVFDHQSQEATDCRWLRLLPLLAAGQLHLPSREMVEQLVYYPKVGDQRLVRPFIRAGELSFANEPGKTTSTWPAAFWSQCWHATGCISRELTWQGDNLEIGTTAQLLGAVAEQLAEISSSSASTTAIDAKHEAVFGIAAYSISLLRELLPPANATGILGRLGLRALFEARVVLAYLDQKDSQDLWRQYRSYGTGQAKLAFLKLNDDAVLGVGFTSADALMAIANEDQSADFLRINLGNWEGSNLRKMSDEVDVKGDYDRYFPWTSAYVHGNWGAIRECQFNLCVNALHRAHRVLRPEAVPLNDVLGDACELVDATLSIVSKLYPSFTGKVSIASSVE